MRIDECIARAIDNDRQIDVGESHLASKGGERLEICESKDLPHLAFEPKVSWSSLFRSSMNKAFCTCGAIAELDSTTISLKRRLGKDVECRYCRNQRISEELEEMKILYSESDEGWLYG